MCCDKYYGGLPSMSTNLLTLASQYMTPDVVTKISSALGLDRSSVGRACGAAIPALFGQFANLASTPNGARTLYGAVSQQDTNILSNLSNVVGGQLQHGWMEQGAHSLSSLLGGSSLSALTGALGKFAGAGQSSMLSLLGMLTPIVMAILGKQTAEQGLDPSGLGRLLASQQENFAAAMPSGFKSLLPSPAGERELPRSTGLRPDRVQASSWARNLAWILPLIAAIALLGWWASGDRTAKVAEQVKPESAQTRESITVAGVDLKSSAQKALNSVNSTLQDIKDQTSAQAALPKLETAGTELDDVIRLSDQLPEAGRKALGAVVAAAQPATAQLFDKVLAIPGVKEVAKPHIDSLRAKIDTLKKDQVRL